MKKLLFILTIFLLATACCKKETNNEESLPDATQTGRGIFACYVDGKPFIDNKNQFNCGLEYVAETYGFHIAATDTDYYGDINHPTHMSMGMSDSSVTIVEGGTYTFYVSYPVVQDTQMSAACYFYESRHNSLGIETEYPDYTGELHITKLDYTNYIISGTFWFDIKNPYTNKKVKIRDGRFDVKFYE